MHTPCIFCATRFQSVHPASARISRRRLNTTRPPHQSAAAAQVSRAALGASNSATSSESHQSWSADSTLTSAEQREKEHRRQQRLAREAQQEGERIAALERQHAEDERRREAAEFAKKRRAEEEERRLVEARIREMDKRRRSVIEAEQRKIDARKADMEARERREQEDQDTRREMKRQRESELLFRGPQVKQISRETAPDTRIGRPAFGDAALQDPRSEAWGGGLDDVKPIEYNKQPEAPIVVPNETSAEKRSAEGSKSPFNKARLSPRRSEGAFGQNVQSRGPTRIGRRSVPSMPSFGEDVRQNATIDQWGASAEDIAPIEYSANDRKPREEFNGHIDQSRSQAPLDYQAVPFKLEDYLDHSTKPNDGNAVSWSHLRPQPASSFYSPPPPPPPTKPQRQSRLNPFDDPEQIERSFREHQQQRPRRRRSIFDAPTWESSTGAITGTPHAQVKCGRCLEKGHTARECTGPMRARCNFCGDIGHVSARCPKNVGAREWQTTSRPLEQERVPLAGPRRVGSSDSLTIRRVYPGGPPPTNETALKDEDGKSIFETSPVWNVKTSSEDYHSSSSPFAFPGDPATRKLRQELHPAFSNLERAKPSGEWMKESSIEANELSSRRARRSARGFDDEIPDRENFDDRRALRKSRRNFDARDEDFDETELAVREERAAQKAERKAARKAALAEQRATVHLPEFVSVQNLAQVLGVHYEKFVQRLGNLGYEDIFPGKVLNKEISGMIAMEYAFDPVFEGDVAGEGDAKRDLHPAPEIDDLSALPLRPPVVTIMGHVDHGKTTILDYLRKTSVAAGEAGGITQHIGAFSVPISSLDGEKAITFLDTPGHAAFLSMRQRGANVTDIVVLVVAADDSVKPQTLESLRCAREANVPILVAINKVDKEGADIQRVKNDLSQHGIEIEAFGGDVQVVEVSGKTGQGMDTLTEALVTLGEVLEKKADLDGAVEGWVLEATTSKTSGRVATVLVKRGTLKPGDVLVAGTTWARVRTLRDERGEVVETATPGIPVEVDGWRTQPSAGDQVLQAAAGEHQAGQVVEYRIERAEREKMDADIQAINEARRAEQLKKAEKQKGSRFAAYADMYDSLNNAEESPEEQNKGAETQQEEQQGQITVPFLIKADVSGSAEAVTAYLPSLTNPLVAPQIIFSGVGPVNPSDIDRASAAKGHIIAFNLPADEGSKGAAQKEGVRILENNVIYRVLDDVKEVLEERLPPILTQRVTGEAEVSAAFDISVGGRKTMRIAGCKVRNGMMSIRSRVKVTRGIGGEKVYDGELPPSGIDHLGLLDVADHNSVNRFDHESQEREERRPRDAEGDRVRYGL